MDNTNQKLLSIRDLAQWLQIKPTTLYAWVAQRKIPCLRIHGLIRFCPKDINHWLQSLQSSVPKTCGSEARSHTNSDNLRAYIAHLTDEAYTSFRGKPDQAKAGKEVDDDL